MCVFLQKVTMHDIEPYHRWRDYYVSAEDPDSPFFGRRYDEFYYTNKVYNYFIHPQWDDFGSDTLYLKVLFADYEEGFTIIEMIGEWNDCLHNDIMFLKRDVIDAFIEKGVHKYILICENVLNFHGSDDAYYEEWYEDISDAGGWICVLNTLTHVSDEMRATRLQYFINFGDYFEEVNWRPHTPQRVFRMVEVLLRNGVKRLREY
ncbi:MAG TPA: hypothetical protein PKC76_18055 [Saprospiraceae bacterium]|nr:hypothetical protein [Saprospiraceae bacterium]HMP26038.1 hypothetical protein [Saprospiraceae bacterium]